MTGKLGLFMIATVAMMFMCKAQDATKVVNSYLLERFDSTKNYRDAKSACEGRNSRLVEIKTQEIQEAVYDLIKFRLRGGWFIGATQIEQEFKWNDGSKLAYTNWNNGEPNNEHEKCTEIIDSHGRWNDISCTDAKGYICQQVLVAITFISPTIIRAPVTTGSDHVNCTAQGNPTPTVKWIKDGVAVNTLTSSNVYQTIQATTSKLWIGNAIKSDAGTYTCKANNTVGGDSVQEEQNITLIVLGSPLIVSATVTCRERIATLNIKWQTDNTASALTHRFTITVGNNKEGKLMYKNVTSQPQGGIQETAISGLQEANTYKITVHVCPDLCINKLNASSQVTTAVNVIPGPVQEVFLISLSDGNCFVNWKKQIETEKSEIQGYQIITGGQLVYSNACTETPKNISTKIYNVSNQVTQFTLQTSPNRDYSVKIQTRTCAVLGPAVTATGSCITQRSAPTNVLVPELIKTNEDGTMEMRIQIPDESNGPMSCIFLMLKLGEISTDFIFTINDLNQAQAAAKASSLADNAQYIAIAITRVTVPTSFNLTVGDNTKSFCNPGLVYGSMNTQNEDAAVYEGRNWPLRDRQTYSYFAVTTTPVGNQILLKTSPANKFVTKPTSEPTLLCIHSSTLAAIIVPAIIISLIVGGLVGSYIMNRRLQATSLPNSQNINRNPAFQESTNNLPRIDEGTYEPIPGQSSTGYEEPKQTPLYDSIKDPAYQDIGTDVQPGNSTTG